MTAETSTPRTDRQLAENPRSAMNGDVATCVARPLEQEIAANITGANQLADLTRRIEDIERHLFHEAMRAKIDTAIRKEKV
jgi:hypothetical protein